MGNLEKAHYYYKKAFDIALNDKSEDASSNLSLCYNNLGILFSY